MSTTARQKTTSSQAPTTRAMTLARRKTIQTLTEDFYKEKISWALHAWKNIAGESYLRNEILKAMCSGNYKESSTYLGPTIMGPDTTRIITKINTALTLAHKAGKRRVFVSFAEPAEIGEPTHFVGLVFFTDIPLLLVYDPARPTNTAKTGVYNAPYLETILDHYRLTGFKIKHYQTRYVCQATNRDVYCQTWVLYFLVHKLCIDDSMNIPARHIARLDLILSFIKDCLKIPKIAKEFRKEYTALTLHMKEDYENDDPVEILQNCVVDDLP